MTYNIYFDSNLLTISGLPDYFHLTVIDNYGLTENTRFDWNKLVDKIDCMETFSNLQKNHGVGQNKKIAELKQLSIGEGMDKLRELLNALFRNKTLFITCKVNNLDKQCMSILVSKKNHCTAGNFEVVDDVLVLGKLPYELDVYTALGGDGFYETRFRGFDRQGNNVSNWVALCKLNNKEDEVLFIIRTCPDVSVWLESGITKAYIEQRIFSVLACRKDSHERSSCENRIYLGNTDSKTVENPQWYEQVKNYEFSLNRSHFRRMYLY